MRENRCARSGAPADDGIGMLICVSKKVLHGAGGFFAVCTTRAARQIKYISG